MFSFIKIEHFPFILVAYLVLKHQHHLKLTTWHAIPVFALLMMYRTNVKNKKITFMRFSFCVYWTFFWLLHGYCVMLRVLLLH